MLRYGRQEAFSAFNFGPSFPFTQYYLTYPRTDITHYYSLFLIITSPYHSTPLHTPRGTGRKLGEGVQFTCTVIGGFIYAFYVSWRVSLIVLAAVPVMAGSSAFMMTVTTKQTERKNKSYAETGGIVYSTIAAIRTVYSLNAVEPMIKKFKASTEKNYKQSISFTYLVGLGSGAMMGSFLISYIALTLYGAYLLYDQVEETGCDPSNTLGINPCKTVGTEGTFYMIVWLLKLVCAYFYLKH